METLLFILIIVAIYAVAKLVENIKDYSTEIKKAKVLLAKQTEIEQKEQLLKKEEYKLNDRADELDAREEDIRLIAEDNSQNSPWLAERYADYYEMVDNKVQSYLLRKKNPAKKASEIVSEVKKEKKNYEKKTNYCSINYNSYYMSFLG